MSKEDVNNTAEPSAAAAVAAGTQFDGWDENGTPIVTREIQPEKQESAPAAEPAKEAASENEAESETATTQERKERKPGEKLNREERIAQLAAQNKKLAEELKAERERSREAAPKPPAKEPEPVQAEAPKRPNPFKWTGTAEEYEAAMEAWETHQKGLAVQEFQRNEAIRALNEKTKSQLEELKARYPDADNQKMKAAVDELVLAPKVHIPGVIKGMLSDTEVFVDLMYVLSDETTRSNFIETITTNPGKAIRVLAQMERDIAAASKPEPPARSEPKPPVEQKPRAPKPPSEVGGRGTAPEDALRAAAQANDFRSFEAEQNRRKFARSA